MFSNSAELYDAFYSWKDYQADASIVATAIRERVPTATTILDVGCGSGEHARFLSSDHGFHVDGIDVEPAFVELAGAKNPKGTFRQADMRDLDLGISYDAVICLFSSIGYVRTEEGLYASIRSMARHLETEGVLLLEPWLEPGTIRDGYVSSQMADIPDGKACRVSHTSIQDSISRLHFEYLIGTSAGIQREVEIHDLGLFSRETIEGAFQGAGLTTEYDPTGLTDRGLYVARPAP